MNAAPALPADGWLQLPPRQVPLDHPAFAGHFPGQPILPGVVLLAEVLQAWREAAGRGELPPPQPPLQLQAAKFLAPVQPGAGLGVRLQAAATQLRFELLRLDGDGAATLAASGSFALATAAAAGGPAAGAGR
ncbi:3-hydroxyacyl-ACP dehydratase [Aquabacterium sp. OR-4]|uniref:3-hydroxyacyl-ACP dehydratase n=1 Tax=Aquabacterium sp. OR-4 TaxID=2978127 RepID=UPI0021B2CBA6|nr:3-hydroxyacyl-ACP dehydratase [Aquabacterium sp. OR-4]MDT7836740.1 3-hydroxyacyl-ACP dehydratase [Aquabacterium sp. OR-4]